MILSVPSQSFTGRVKGSSVIRKPFSTVVSASSRWDVIGSQPIDPHPDYSLFDRYCIRAVRPPAKLPTLTPHRTAITMTAQRHAHFAPRRGVNGAPALSSARSATLELFETPHDSFPLGRYRLSTHGPLARLVPVRPLFCPHDAASCQRVRVNSPPHRYGDDSPASRPLYS